MVNWNGLMLPLSYSHSLQMQHLAIRTQCGLTDMSGIRKYSLKESRLSGFYIAVSPEIFMPKNMEPRSTLEFLMPMGIFSTMLY